LTSKSGKAVKLDKLLKRLKRDLAASPQKAAALGLMVLVAAYFWAPLVMKWVGKPGKTTQAVVTPVNLPDSPVVVQSPSHPATDSARWNHVRLAMAQDQLMRPTPRQTSWTNPFNRLKSKRMDEAELAQAEPTTVAPSAIQIAQPAIQKEHLAGITISSILITSRDAAVVVRGSVYRVNDMLPVHDTAEGQPLELRIVRIDAQGMDLEHETQTYRVDRVRPKLSPGDHVRDDAGVVGSRDTDRD
jgi:hypothetical protein